MGDAFLQASDAEVLEWWISLLHFTHSCSCNKQCLRHWDALGPLRGLALLPSNCFLKSFAIFLENIRIKSFLEKILEHYDVKCNENVHKFMKKYNPHWTFTLIIDIIQNSSEFIRFRTKQCKTERSPLWAQKIVTTIVPSVLWTVKAGHRKAF